MNKNKTVFVFGVLLIFSLFFVAFISTAQASTINTTFTDTSITPNPSGPGQPITIITTISPPPPPRYHYSAVTFAVVDRNGNYRVIGTTSTQPGNGTLNFRWTPDIPGTFLVIFTYKGEMLAGDVYTPCQSNASFVYDPSLPSQAPTPTPTQTPNPEPNSTPTTTLETSLNVSCQSSTTYLNFKVNIQGTLTLLANNSGLSNSSVQLSYSVDGGNSYTPLTLATTDDNGAFQAVWTPLVTGTYFLRATYNGTSEFSPADTVVHFAVLPVEDTSVFSVTSNSTVTALSFNSTTQDLSFKVSGETGTTGYVNIYISKSLMNDTSNLNVYFDQEILQPITQSVGDSWLVSFTYHHSMHTVTLALNSEPSNIQMQTQNLLYIAAGVGIAFLAIAATMMLLKSKAKRKNV